MAREKKPYDLPYWIGLEMLAGGHYLFEGGIA